jgi:myosin heavy subunit
MDQASGTTTKWIAGILTVLLGGALAGGIFYWDKSGNLASEKDKMELKADSMLSVKLNLEREILNLSTQINDAVKDNKALGGQVHTANAKLKKTNALLHTFQKSNQSQLQDIAHLNQQLAQLENVRNSLKDEFEALQNEKSTLANENKELKVNNADLSQQVNQLTVQMKELVPRTLITADNFSVDVLKSNEKLTAKAKKANALVVSMTLPAALKKAGEQDVFLSITDLQNIPMSGAIGTQAINAADGSVQVPVYAVKKVDFGHNPQKVTFHFEPTQKVEAGTYKVRIYTPNAYLGSTEFSLRESFLFF